jgi:hypothetical protein
MWRATENRGVAPGEYLVWVPAERVRPINGVDYTTVPTTRPVPDVPPPAGARWGWKLQPKRSRGRPGGSVVHVHDCPDATGTEISLDEALAALRRPGNTACKQCQAAEALTSLA